MDSQTSSRHDVDLLEHVLLDENAEPTSVPLSLLEEITNCFSDDHRIGSGGFAVVYKGIVGKGLVAVKKLSITFGLYEDKFHKEVECLMKAKHKNIVRFIGYCSDAQGRIADNEGKFVMADIRNLLLCFEYVPNGSLDKYITDASCGLEWRERYRIIKGICEGLLHLHEKHILHLDLKPANILVDDQMIPKITDFGLSRCLDKEQTRDITSNLYGSLGYMAPEFLFSSEVAFASDIYSLGVIIVEILIGKKGYPEEEDVVKNWTNRLEASDQRDTQLEQVRVCIKIGIECMGLDPKKRPGVHDIIDRLDKTASTVEMGISSSPVEQKVSFLKDQYCQGETAKLSPEYLRKDILEHAETEELVEYVGSPRKDHSQQGQQDALGDQWSLWEAEYAKQNVTPQDARISSSNSLSSSNSGLLYKLNNLEVFNKKAQKNYIRYSGPMVERASNLKLFKMGELKPILKDEYLLRKDDFGKVYGGMIEKVLVTIRKPSHVNMLNAKVFAQEVIIQSKIIRRNIVRVLGCCLESDVPMLVCEYFSKVSLHDVLHSNDKGPLDLDLRLSIAAESAQGLAYMHSQSSYTTILHGNFAPGNILLDEDYLPKISDIGISRMTGQYYEHTGGIIGDIAYMDPVYLQTGRLTEQSDVYSFGVVILELLTRKKATHTDNNSIVRKFLENHWQGRKSTELFDKEIAVTEDLDLLDNLAKLAVICLNFDADLRPKMTQVSECLSILNKSRQRWFTS